MRCNIYLTSLLAYVPETTMAAKQYMHEKYLMCLYGKNISMDVPHMKWLALTMWPGVLYTGNDDRQCHYSWQFLTAMVEYAYRHCIVCMCIANWIDQGFYIKSVNVMRILRPIIFKNNRSTTSLCNSKVIPKNLVHWTWGHLAKGGISGLDWQSLFS